MFKKYKLNQLQKIKQTYKYIYIYRYNDLTTNENIYLKKKLKKLKFKSLILKQNLNNRIFTNTKGQGSTLLIYGNNDINLITNLIKFKKIELIYLIANNIIFSNLKLKQILISSKVSLNISIIRPFFNLLYYLRKI